MTARVRVLSGGAAHGLVEAMRPAFEAERNCRIAGIFSAVGAMRDKLVAGDPADLMILSRALIDALARDGHVDASSVRDIGTVATSVAVRSGDPLPALGNANALRAALQAADEIHFPDPKLATAGIHFAKVMAQLGVDDAAKFRPAPNGATAMRALAASKSRQPIGCTQATEILTTAGIVLAAPLPPGCELVTTYTAAVTTRAAQPADAAELIRRLAAPDQAATRKRLGFG
jgi:molybdate transport system substrate-binding protein